MQRDGKQSERHRETQGERENYISRVIKTEASALAEQEGRQMDRYEVCKVDVSAFLMSLSPSLILYPFLSFARSDAQKQCCMLRDKKKARLSSRSSLGRPFLAAT